MVEEEEEPPAVIGLVADARFINFRPSVPDDNPVLGGMVRKSEKVSVFGKEEGSGRREKGRQD